MFKPLKKALPIIIGLAVIILMGTSCSLQQVTNTNSDAEKETNTNAKAVTNVNAETTTDKITVGAVENDLADLERQQTSVDNGSQPWRLDPLTVAITESPNYGFATANDTFSLTEKIEMGVASGTGEAYVAAIHNGVTYEIQLFQPVKQDTQGIWAINSIRKK